MDQAKLKHQQEQLLAYHNYLPMVEQLIEQVRTRQHEYDNILQAMRSLPFTCPDYPSLVSALGTYANDFQRDPQHSSLLKINLKLVAGFLYNKLHEIECKDKHIYIDIRQHVLPTNVPEFVLVEVLGIMIDNMVEASSPDDTPTLILDVEIDRLVITTNNYGPQLNPDLRKKFFTKGYSTKPEESKKRGYGLPRLLEIVNESNGKLYLDNATEPLTRRTLVIFTAKI